MKLAGKCAIITGAGRGLGRASAVAMAGEGAGVVLVSRTRSELEETERLIARNKGRGVVVAADVGRPEALTGIVETAVRVFGTVDILLNNAAVITPLTMLVDADPEEWDAAMDINLRAPYLLSRLSVPYMREKGGGKIINVTSGLGEMVMPPFGVYSISKAGLIHQTKIMAEELKTHNIQVNGLDPAVMDTRMQEDIRSFGPAVLGEEVFENFLSLKERGELLSPERVARLAVFLASSGSDGITGENGTERHYRRMGFA